MRIESHSRTTLLLLCILFTGSQTLNAKDTVIVLSAGMFNARQEIPLAELDGWVFRQGNDPSWARRDFNPDGWKRMRPVELSSSLQNDGGVVEGWFRTRIRIDSTLEGVPLGLSRKLWAATDVYVDGILTARFGSTNPLQAYNPVSKYPVPLKLWVGEEHLLAMHFVDREDFFTERHNRLKPENLAKLISVTGPDYDDYVRKDIQQVYIYNTLWISITGLLSLLFWLLVFLNRGQRVFLLVAILTSLVLFLTLVYNFGYYTELPYWAEKLRVVLYGASAAALTAVTLVVFEWILKRRISLLTRLILLSLPIASVIAHLHDISFPFGIINATMMLYFVYLGYTSWKSLTKAQWAVIASMVAPTLGAAVFTSIHKYDYEAFLQFERPLLTVIILSAPLLLTVYIAVRYNEILKEIEEEGKKVLKVTEEKNEILSNQNIMLERQVTERTSELNRSLSELKATQNQLITQEKLASLGQLTAGIAHEIKNPLNFVNNFSSVSVELVDEALNEISKTQVATNSEVAKLLGDVKVNLGKIIEHGKRADGIVKSMLQHSRGGSGKKEPTDVNALVKEYVTLAFHGMRAGKNPMNVDIVFDLDQSVGTPSLIAEDFSRVVLNLCQNAFDAMREKSASGSTSYLAKLSVRTKRESNRVILEIADNGPGISDAIKDKILQPFFTTKKGTQGTGLGLSITNDIMKAHGGQLSIETNKSGGATFYITLPN